MDRRNFLRTLVGGVAASAAVRTWPFRVYSFPTNIRHIEQWDGPVNWVDYGLSDAQAVFLLNKDGIFHIFGGGAGRCKLITQEMDIEEAKRRYHFHGREIDRAAGIRWTVRKPIELEL